MIKAGKSFCPYCVRVHHKAFYSDQNQSWGVWLCRNKFSGKYEAKAEDFKKGTAPQGKIRLLKSDEKDGGLPSAIQLEVYDDKKGQGSSDVIRMYRSCPVCAEKDGKNRLVNWVLGKYPTFVIAMIGDRSAGKSAWLDSIATYGNTSAVNGEGYVHTLNYTTPTTTEKRPSSTDPGSRGQSKVLLICDSQDENRVVAVVYLVDVAGELYNATAKENKDFGATKRDLIWNLLDKNIDYPGADGYIFVAPAVNKHKNQNPDQAYEEYPADDIYRDLRQQGLLQGKPLAYVMTHADKLIDSGEFTEVASYGDGKKYPSMTKDTFNLNRPTSYARQDMLSRIALENAIVRSYEPAVLSRQDGPTKCFLVRSCDLREETHTQKGITKQILMEDFRASRNVMDPLLWMLNQLKLFPLRERAE